MIIFLYGPDFYRRRQKLNEIIDKYRQRGADERRFDFGDADYEEEFLRLKEFVSNRSIFENKKLAVIENIFLFEKAKQAVEILKDNIENKDVVLLISEGKSPPAEFKFLINQRKSVSVPRQSSPLVQEFKILEPAQLEFFIKKEAEKRNLNLTSLAIQFLAEVFKGDSCGIVNELEKLSLLSSKNLEVAQLKEIIDYYQPIIQQKFFYAVNGILGNFSAKQKLINLEILLSYQEEPAKIFNFLASLAKNVSAIRKLADYDAAIKAGKMDYEEALVEFALE